MPNVPPNPYHISLPADLRDAAAEAAESWRARRGTARLWARDATLWTGKDEARWLGWLTIARDARPMTGELRAFADAVRADGPRDILLLGMGGSSLAPDVLRMTFGHQPGWPDLHVLDSTDPAQVRAFERRLDLTRALVIVASKSGSTLEPNILAQYFRAQLRQRVGERETERVVAITDPGSQLHQLAEREGFRRVFFGVPEIGGRFSALSAFGLVPAALMGVDVDRLLTSAEQMMAACGPDVDVADNPGVRLGLLLGTLANRGRDKLTVVTSPSLCDAGAWLEQLVAESTGKNHRAIIPVDRERLFEPRHYHPDRVFVSLTLEGEQAHDDEVSRLESAGHPVVRITVGGPYDIAQEFFRWEMATAVAGALMGINPFDQPDVEASKVATRALTAEYERQGRLPASEPLTVEAPLSLFADSVHGAALAAAAGPDRTAAAVIRAHLATLRPGDYFALLAFVEMSDANISALQEVRHLVAGAHRAATCLGFGPRFLHSTGQAYKGGPNTGVFLQLTCEHAEDVAVPGQTYTFGIVELAQALGDFQVLSARGRRALRIHLGVDVAAGLAALRTAVAAALS